MYIKAIIGGMASLLLGLYVHHIAPEVIRNYNTVEALHSISSSTQQSLGLTWAIPIALWVIGIVLVVVGFIYQNGK